MEEHNSYVISSQELQLIFALTFSKLWGKQGRTTTRMCLPFYSLIMKIMVLKGVRPSKDGIILACQCPISLVSLQMSKSHSSTKRKKQNLSKTPKSESFPHATPSSHCSAAHSTPRHTETTSPHTPKPQSTSTQPG